MNSPPLEGFLRTIATEQPLNCTNPMFFAHLLDRLPNKNPTTCIMYKHTHSSLGKGGLMLSLSMIFIFDFLVCDNYSQIKINLEVGI